MGAKYAEQLVPDADVQRKLATSALF